MMKAIIILKELYALSPWLILGLFSMLLLSCYAMYRLVYVLVYPDDGKTKVFGDELTHWPYEPLDLMTDSEVRFFRILQQAVGEEYLIFSQVQLSRVIDAQNDVDAAKWLNRINRMSVDYLLVDHDAQTSLIVIELDDWSHEKKHRQRADAKKDKALSCAGIPVMRFHGEHMPTVKELAREINQVILENYTYE